jgi:hypothetical protein
MSSNGYDIGNSRSSTGSAIDIGYFEILGEIGRKITPANYDNCRGSAAGIDWREVGEIAGRCATNTKPGSRPALYLRIHGLCVAFRV